MRYVHHQEKEER